MVDYRIYCLDGKGRIGFAQWFKADTDEDAIIRARTLRPDAEKCEVWDQNRLVASLNGSSEVRDHRWVPSQPQGIRTQRSSIVSDPTWVFRDWIKSARDAGALDHSN